MPFSIIESLKPGASARSRRAAIAGAGGVTLAALMHQAPAGAGKAGKKARKRCRKQIGQCEEAMSSACTHIAQAFRIAPDACRAAMLPCCSSFDGCRAGTAITCLYSGMDSLSASRPEL